METVRQKAIANKIRRAKTDPLPLPDSKEGLAGRPEAENLLNIYAALADKAQEAVIAGYTAPRRGQRPFGALVLGVYQGGELVYIGHSGGSFGAQRQQEIFARLQPLAQAECPFRAIPEPTAPAVWVRPEVVCEMAFSGWTDDGLLRHPVFVRLREDKPPREVVRENNEGA